MARANVNTLSAIVLLLFCGTMAYASFAIRVTSYSTMQPSVWPRLILAGLAIMSAILLVRSIVAPSAVQTLEPGAQTSADDAGPQGLARYISAIWIFGLFLAFLLTLPWLGMPLAGSAFVFLTLSILGPNDRKSILIHLMVAILAVAFMWAVFFYGLHVFLPEGELFYDL